MEKAGQVGAGRAGWGATPPRYPERERSPLRMYPIRPERRFRGAVAPSSPPPASDASRKPVRYRRFDRSLRRPARARSGTRMSARLRPRGRLLRLLRPPSSTSRPGATPAPAARGPSSWSAQARVPAYRSRPSMPQARRPPRDFGRIPRTRSGSWCTTLKASLPKCDTMRSAVLSPTPL